ncbi:hypothetical protein N0B16_05000 [Chryseobacterium sp. GMJ5]|uniref:Lipoprotein n=1 Tax=Chryseobacterium gilvum TaxID=2976534 RepID=A0ABT2VXG4_9FLAO|nr:hypothetical protein [Chryseobacterium gilvum]MCU7613789.1 hypothetical protein [Chryseobacterium gilvum]
MKKLMICLAVASIAVSCKKIQAGGNKQVIKLEEGVERYSDDEQTSGKEEDLAVEHKGDDHAMPLKAESPKADSIAAKNADSITTRH